MSRHFGAAKFCISRALQPLQSALTLGHGKKKPRARPAKENFSSDTDVHFSGLYCSTLETNQVNTS